MLFLRWAVEERETQDRGSTEYIVAAVGVLGIEAQPAGVKEAAVDAKSCRGHPGKAEEKGPIKARHSQTISTLDDRAAENWIRPFFSNDLDNTCPHGPCLVWCAGHASQLYIPVAVGICPPTHHSPTIQRYFPQQMRGDFVLELHSPRVTTVRSHSFWPGLTVD